MLVLSHGKHGDIWSLMSLLQWRSVKIVTFSICWNSIFIFPFAWNVSEHSLNRSRRRRGKSPWWSSLMWMGDHGPVGPSTVRNRLHWWNPTSAATAALSTMVKLALLSGCVDSESLNRELKKTSAEEIKKSHCSFNKSFLFIKSICSSWHPN